MKKFKMMLPALAVIFAIVGAVAGDLLPSTQAYYEVTSGVCSQPQTIQKNCDVTNDNRPVCTISVGGTPHQAFKNGDCSGILRDLD
jgi:hypothetical protein